MGGAFSRLCQYRGTADPNPGPTNTALKIDPIEPAPRSKIHNRSPLIAAKISDADSDLARSNIKLFVAGRPITKYAREASIVGFP